MTAAASILVVDDTLENLKLLASMLGALGYEVRPVTNGRQALVAAERHAPDLVLLDINMPEQDGYEVCRRFKAIPALADIPIVFLTALSEVEDKVLAFQAGGVDYITKPFQIEEVHARVRTHLALSQAHRTLADNYARLRELETMRDDLVHMIVHDMRSPLMVMIGHLDLVRESALDRLDAESSVLGRFGWKANQPNLAQQTFAAFHGDIGITSELFPRDNCPASQAACAAAPPSETSPNLQEPKASAMVVHALGLAVPARRNLDDAQALHGEQLFTQAGCGTCHIQQMETGELAGWPELSHQTIHPYTDLLLHDMGPELADGRTDFEASGSEWRTPPLWSLGVTAAIDGYLFLLHDGRARSFAEAILWHGGQAEAAREAFRSMPQRDREALVAFLTSL